MKISKIETVRLTSRPTLIWVRVHTDEGLVGLGESWFGCAAIEADVHERIAPAFIGADPSRIEALTRAARPYVGFCGTGAEIRAVSALDVALWDLAGQAAGKPLYELLGGAMRADIPVYNTCAGPDYVSQSSDVRPQNFGLTGTAPAHGRTAGSVCRDGGRTLDTSPKPHCLAARSVGNSGGTTRRGSRASFAADCD